MDISLFMKLQKRVRELEQERKRLQSNVDKMEELANRRVMMLKMLLFISFPYIFNPETSSFSLTQMCFPVSGL